MGTVLANLGANQEQTTVTAKAKLVVDNGGKFAGMVLAETDVDVLTQKKSALEIARGMVAKVTAD